MGSKYYDSQAAIQVISAVLEKPSLLSQSGEYFFNEDDFQSDFHRTMFGVLYNCYSMGTEYFTPQVVTDYIANRPKTKAELESHNYVDWMAKNRYAADLANFDYYYGRLKKMTLLRKYEEAGVDVSWLCDPDNIEVEEAERQNDYMDSLSLEEVANLVDDRVLNIREAYVDNSSHVAKSIGDGLEETIAELREKPAVGAHLFDDYTNSACMGARRGKFYLRSAATGVGKSRTMMGDACTLACSEYYDIPSGTWKKTGNLESVLYISVELDDEELKTMALAFVSGVSEDKIIGAHGIGPSFEEEERIRHGIEVLKNSKLFFEYIPDYGLIDIENSIKRNLRKHKCCYIFMDYITTSMKIISDLARQSGGMKLREDQVLFQLSSKLKDIASVYNVFIMSATQLNAQFKTEKIPDQTLLAGAKAIANRIDVGMIMLTPTEDDIEMIAPILDGNLQVPNIKMSIYKNRRGKHVNMLLWMYADKSTCRYTTMFATDFQGNLINKEEFTFFETEMIG